MLSRCKTVFWRGRLDVPPTCLSHDERRRCTVLNDPEARLSATNAHILKRHALSRWMPSVSPEAWCFEGGAWGKPLVRGNEPQFSLTHDGDACAVTVAEHPVGIDIEKIRTLHGIRALAERILTGNESQWLKRQEEPSSAIIRLWTTKEAVLKARGDGLYTWPGQVSVDSPQCDFGWVFVSDGTAWYRQTRYEDGFWMSVAIQAEAVASYPDSRLIVMWDLEDLDPEITTFYNHCDR